MNGTSKQNGKQIVIAAATAAGILAAVGAARGQDYALYHPLNLTTQGNVAPTVTLEYQLTCSSYTNSCHSPEPPVSSGSVAAPGLGTWRSPMWFKDAPDSWAAAQSEVDLSALGPGRVAGSYGVMGYCRPLLTGCGDPPTRYGYAYSYATADVKVQGRNSDKRGHISDIGNAVAAGSVEAGPRSITTDPIRARLTDLTTGLSTDYTLMSVELSAVGGSVSWTSGLLSSTATGMTIDLKLGAAVTVQHGHLRIASVGGFITESVATGDFAGLPIPPIGGSSAFSMPLPTLTIDYDLGGDDSHDLATQLEFINGRGLQQSVADSGATTQGTCILTDVGSGAGLCAISELNGDGNFGYNASADSFHVADAFLIPPGPPGRLGGLVCPVYQPGAPLIPLTGAYVRIWSGQPGAGGVPIAGDMTTNRVTATRFIGAFRVGADPLDTTRPLQEADIDLSWAPPLAPGEYWLELGLRGQPGPQGPFVPPTVWRTTQDRAISYNVQTAQWMPAFDPQSQRQVRMPFRVIAASGQPQQCYANCDNSTTAPVLNVLDISCFLNRFAAGDPYANCDNSTTPPVLNVLDFSCFLNKFAAGCP